MANKNWRSGQTEAGISTSGSGRMDSGTDKKAKRKRAADDPDPKSVKFTPAEDGDGYITETEYDNSGEGPYKSPTQGIHSAGDSADDKLEQAFGKIDKDETLDPAEKRRAKAKASMKHTAPAQDSSKY